MNTTLTSRILAGATIVGAIYAGAMSGVFGTFSPTIISGQSCSGYGYYGYGYGYGYDCTPVSTTTTTPTGGGPGGGTNGTPLVIDGQVIPTGGISPFSDLLFPNFTPACGGEATSLRDPAVLAYYDVLKVIDRSNLDRTLTRAEFLKLVLNASGVDVSSAGTTTPFSDVNSNMWYASYVAYAVKGGIVQGDNGLFRPNDTITRAEASKIFVRATGVTYSTGSIVFSDVLPTNTLAVYIQTAYDNCIVHGRHTVNGVPTTPTRLFEGWDGITLGETAKILYNMTR